MHAKRQITLTRKTLYGLMLLAIFLATFVAGNLPAARAQGTTAQTPTGVVVSLSTDKAFFDTAEDVTLHVTITNPNDYSIRMLKWFTPVEGVERPLFTVTRDGEPVTYLGALNKRAAPTEQDYITLTAGESLTSDVNLSAYYDLSVSGNYEVRYDVKSIQLYAKENNGQSNNDGRLTSNTVDLFIEGRVAPTPKEIIAQTVSGSNGFTSCSASQQTDVISARSSASTYATDAVSYFSANRTGPRYTTWFGTYLLSRYSTVTSHFSSVSSAVDTANPMNFDCSCPNYPGDPSVYAYVYPNSPYNIYLCGAFWNAPLTGTDSKAGVLIHEITHFTVVAGTHDHVYGQTGAKALAISNPTNAVDNADNHEYFVENTPPIYEPAIDTTPPSGVWTSPSNDQTISSRSVNLSVNASDNSGGSGVKEVRFSAMWGGTWRGVGTASSSPYSVSWDMCSSGVPNGDIELGFEVWDNANNKWVYSEHFGNIHINKSYTCTQGTDTTPPTGYWTSPGNGQTISSQSVTLSVNASDNSGGSGVREVRWSAKWNNQWSGIGTDNTSPYSINWDMCASGVPNGDVELGMEVWDNANNKWVYSEHYTNYHINKNYTCNSSTGGWETWGWQNKYLAGYDNWHGTVTWRNDYPYIWWDFGTGGPFGWGGNEFSLRMQKDVYFPGGDYSFHTEHDDGVKVYIDGNLIIDAWWDGNGVHAAGRNVSQGNHQIKVEFYENQGDAKLHVFWYGPGYPQPDNNPPDGRITSPANYSATSSSPITITADAWDDASGVDHVEFYVWYCDGSCSWHLISTDYSSPYSADWDWSALSDQHVYLTIHVIDKTGKVRDDPGGYVEVDLDRTSPTANITSPLEGTMLYGIVPIQVDASDSLSGVGTVQFIVGYSDTAGASLQGRPEPPSPAKIDENGEVTTSDLTAQDYWEEIGWDDDGSDGWSFNWDTSSIPEQSGIAVFVYVYDKAWNYQGAVQWNMSLFRPPVNDDISTPIQINSNSYTNQQNIYNASNAADDPALTDCNRAPGDATVWYQFIPPSDGYYYLNTIGSDYDTMLAVWTGTRGNLNLIACNDDRPSDLQSELFINVNSGVVYYIEIAKYAGPLATSLSAQSEDKLNAAGDVSVLSGGTLILHISESHQIYLPLVIR